MCGRTACTLAPDDVVRACSFRNRRGRYQRPVWKDPPGGQQYYPSHNVAPASHTPVLLSSKHYPEELESFSERVVQPMKWGLVPPWHKGDPYKLEYETNNCRAEGMLTKRTYKIPLEKGNRCVILADGFFEWKRSKEGKQPYFIYFPQGSPHTETEIKPETEQELKTQQIKRDPDPQSSLAQAAKLEPVDIKPDPDPHSSLAQVAKLEPVDIKPDPDPHSSLAQAAKLEPVDIKPDPDPHSSLAQVAKLEPVDIKPDPEELASVQARGDPDAVEPVPSSGELAVPGKTLKQEIKTEAEEAGAGDHDNGARKAVSPEQASRKQAKETTCFEVASDSALTEDDEWKGKRLLTMAGVFDIWQPPDGSSPLYSYSVITVDSSPAMSWIHHRMPAILSTEEEIRDWLDFAEVPLAKAVKAIQPKECVTMHMVSPVVNNSRNNTPECIAPYDPKQVKKSASSNLMMNWLSKAKPAPQEPAPDAKKQKLQ